MSSRGAIQRLRSFVGFCRTPRVLSIIADWIEDNELGLEVRDGSRSLFNPLWQYLPLFTFCSSFYSEEFWSNLLLFVVVLSLWRTLFSTLRCSNVWGTSSVIGVGTVRSITAVNKKIGRLLVIANIRYFMVRYALEKGSRAIAREFCRPRSMRWLHSVSLRFKIAVFSLVIRLRCIAGNVWTVTYLLGETLTKGQ